MTPMRLSAARFDTSHTGASRWALVVAIALALLLLRLWSVQHLGITLYVDEAYYWGWAQALDWGYYSKPPVIAGLIAASTAALGDTVLGVKALCMLLYALTGLVVYGWVRDMADARAAGWAAVLCMTSPLCMLLGLFASTDAPLLLCWAGACWMLWRALTRRGARAWIALGLIVGLGLLSKYTMAAFGLSALVAIVLAHSMRQRPVGGLHHAALALAIAAACLAPNLRWNADHGWPTLAHTAQITLAQHSTHMPWVDVATFVLAQWIGMGALTWWLAVRGGARTAAMFSLPATPTHAFARAYAWAMCLPLLGIGVLQAWHAGAQPNWAAPSVIGLSALAGLSLARRGRAWAALAFNVVLFATVIALPDTRLGSRPLDAFSRMRGWDTALAALTPTVAAYGDGAPRIIGDGRTVLAHAGYHWRALQPQLLAWNPHGLRNDHYQLTASLRDDPGPALFLCDHPDAAAALSRFSHATLLAQSRVQLATGREVHLRLYAVSGFKGYGP